jgi:hypothetical protein
MHLWQKILAAGLLGLLLYVGIYMYALHSDGFKFVEQTIKSSHNIERRVGSVEKIDFPFFFSFKQKNVNMDEIVTMTVQAVGAKGEAILDVKAVRVAGVWKIDNASIDGVPISLVP